MESGDDIAGLPEDFRQSAAPHAPAERIAMAIDADVMAWLRSESADWQGNVNALLRFYMDSSAARIEAFDPDGFEPGDTVQDPLELEFA